MLKQAATLATALASVAMLAPTALAAGPAPAATQAASASLHPCSSQQLTTRASFLQGAAGTELMSIRLTNHSRTACTLQGFARVTMVYGNHGATAGAAAVPITGRRAARYVVRPGRSQSFYVTVEQGPVGGTTIPAGCGRIVPVRGFRVYPPASRTALFAPYTHLDGCAETGLKLLTVYPMGAALR